MSDAVPPTRPAVLPRVLGVGDGVAVVVGSIIGSGIFLKVANVDQQMAQYGFLAILGVWIVVGLATLFGALALAELAAMFPQAGGPYIYLRETFGLLPAFLWGWTEFCVIRTASIGALACATALYLDQLVPLSHYQQAMVAITIVVGLSIANALSTRWGANLQVVFTVIKVGFLGLIIVLPWLFAQGRLDNMQPLLATPDSGHFWNALAAALVAVMWPFDGWINVAPVAEDIREPQRNVPRALVWGMLIVIAVYLGANLSYHFVLTMQETAASKAIAADVFRGLFGPIGAKLAAFGVVCSTFGATNSNMICGPRIYLAMARDGLLPARVHHIHSRWETPANAILLQSSWAVLLIIVFFAWKENPKAAFDGLTDAVICAGIVFYSLTVAAVYVLRSREPHRERPYRTWGYPWTPLLFFGVYFFVFVQLLLLQWKETLGVLGLIAAGVVYYAIARRRTTKLSVDATRVD
ncbi:MAG TPA: APC family permease [Planctomycetaceae bacterium]|jgi:APA family basic amino acid/polyamine antiporter|nr:APC family permease [Planctomycetaceae bacterium]